MKKVLKKLLLTIMTRRIFWCIPDDFYLKMRYRIKMGVPLHLNNPKSFNEKMQWLKLYDRRDCYTDMVDKFAAKEYVGKIIGRQYIIPTIGVYDKFDDINFDQLPSRFVIKCTHDSGGLVICDDKSKINKKEVRKKINKCLRKNYYYIGREWPYKNVRPRIIVEKYLDDSNKNGLRDYKFFCFNGEPKLLYVSDGSHSSNQRIAFFDTKFRHLDIKREDYGNYKILPKRPKTFNKMMELSRLLSKNIPHVRVDWYEVNGKLYFGELTFSTCGGMIPFVNKEWDMKLGRLISLPIVKEQKK